eukprot:scaffold104732_cov17-Tisochrysis_lutea.AAC.1
MHKDTVYNKKVDLVICDEAHTLKNGDSQVTMAVSNLPAVRRLLLSGTPVQVWLALSLKNWNSHNFTEHHNRDGQPAGCVTPPAPFKRRCRCGWNCH